MKIPLNTETDTGAFHCPIHHYYMCTFNEILQWFKPRCDRAPGVLEIYYA